MEETNIPMSQAKHSVNQHPIYIVLAWIAQGAIAIPEIQRPFVWSKTRVRDLMDSLLRGFPVGYLIAWKNPKYLIRGELSDALDPPSLQLAGWLNKKTY